MAKGQYGSVLLVDDEPSVVEMVGRLLRRAGYEVFSADTGEGGIETYRRHQQKIGCVLLDLTLPDLDGAAILNRIRQINPKASVIMCSGYGVEEMRHQKYENPPNGFLEKPFALEDLRGAIEAVKEK